MVLVNGVKYSCDACIKSHRASQCEHTDRPLKLLKPRGRPATTCDHCKDMRKTKNVNPSGSCHCSKLEKIRKEKGITIEEDMMMTGNFDMCLCIRGEPCKCHSRRKKAQKKDKGTEIFNTSPSPALVGDLSTAIGNDNVLSSLVPVDIPPSIDNNNILTTTNNGNDDAKLMEEFLGEPDLKLEGDAFYDILHNQNNTGSITDSGQIDSSPIDNNVTQGHDILQQNYNDTNLEDAGAQGLTLNDLDELLTNGVELTYPV